VTDRQSTARVRPGSKGVLSARPEAVRVKLLGGFSVSVGNRTIQHNEWRLKKAASLVKLLALAHGHRLHREQVMDALWPDLGKKAASNNLRQALHAARKALDPAAGPQYLATEDEQLVLYPKSDLWVDVDAFGEAVATARRSTEPAAYRAAIDLYAGDLLPEDRYERWAEERRQDLRSTYLDLLVKLGGLYEERGEYEKGIETLRRVVAEEPSREEAHAGLMRLYASTGGWRGALQQYERLREVLFRELGTEPDAPTRRLREDIAAGEFPPSQPVSPPQAELPDAGKHNLPAPRDSFVGREREMVEVKRQLAMTRLLTLTGAGGSGKTRLALEVARDLVGAYPDGVWLVELAPLSEGALVPQAVFEALAVREQPGRSLTDVLAEALRSKEMLLVLDNCEHLVEAAAHLVDVLLDECRHMRVLATSREALRVAGEARWAMPGLSVPRPRETVSVRELEGYESVRLFAERARQRDPLYALTPDNAPAVIEVCAKLDGIPLAIELAAAQVGALAVAEIASRLEDSLGLLTRGSRTAVPRQRTIRGALSWSHDLLSDPERTLFRRLSVLTGGFTIEAAEAMGSGEEVGEGDVWVLIGGLADKSLVVAETTGQGEARYRMLEPVRQYASEKLEEGGEAETIRGRHAEFFLELAEESDLGLWGPEEAVWLGRLETEHDNLRAALSWALGGGAPGLGLRMAAALSWFWNARGYYGEGARWLAEALSEGSAPDPNARARVLVGLGRILSEQGHFERAEACLEEALALYEALGDRGRVAEALSALGSATFAEGADVARAKTLYEKSLETARASENRRVIPYTLNGLAHIALENQEFQLARGLWREALAMNRDQGRTHATATILFNMGYTELAVGDQEHAVDLLDEALTLGRELGNEYLVAGCLLILGIATMLRGEPKHAEALIKEGLAIELGLEIKTDTAEFLEGLAEVAGALGHDLRAARLWGAAEALREALDWSWWTAERILHQPLLDATRSRLDDASWEAAFTEGRAMTLEEAVAYALSGGGTDPSATPAPEQPLAEKADPLTRREEEVAALVARGLTNRQIASELVISEHTAATHVARILRKLGLQSRAQLGSWLAEQRLSLSDRD